MAFALSKFAWSFLSPGNLLVFLLAAGMIAVRLGSLRQRRAGWVVCGTAMAALLLIAMTPIGAWALIPLENRFTYSAPDQVEGIIVIGGDEEADISQARGMPTALDSMRRFVTFATLARQFPDARLVFSGGAAFPHPLLHTTEADVAREALAEIGVPVSRMTFERNSRNTYENAVFSADIVRPDPSQKWILVTSAWHMSRAMGCFRKAGWNVQAAPTGYFTSGVYRMRLYFHFDEQLHMLTMAAHEYVGLVSYWLMGRTSALWPI